MDLIVALIAGAVLGGIVAFVLVRQSELGRVGQLREEASANAERIIASAEADAENLKRGAELEAKEMILRAKEDWERELSKRRVEVERMERRLEDREGWGNHTTGGFILRRLPGDHFFLHGHKALLLRYLSEELAQLAREA